MNKWYFGIPLTALVAFFIYYLQFDKEYQAKLKEEARIEEEAKQQKVAEERAARLQAVEEAKAQIEARKIDQAERKAQKEAEDARREEERIAQDRSRTDHGNLRDELKEVTEAVNAEEKQLQAAQELKRQHEQEREHVLAYNEVARKNKERFLGLIDKIEESEKAKVAAANAAAAAKK